MRYMDAAKRLEGVLLDAGVKPRQVKSTMAKICGIKPQSVHSWFDGTTKSPSAEHLAKVAQAYGVNLYWVVTGKGPARSLNAKDEQEALILEILRRLPEDRRALALRQIEVLVD